METTGADGSIRFWLGIGFSVISLAVIFIFIRPAEILASIRETRPDYLLLTLLSMGAFMALRAVRWRFLLERAQAGRQRLSYGQVFHVQSVGYLLTNILPFRLGDVARAVLIGNVPPITFFQGLSTMFVERVFDLLFFVILFPLTLASVENLSAEVRAAVRLAGYGAALAGVILVVAANRPRSALEIFKRVASRLRFLDVDLWAKRFNELLKGLGALTRPSDAAITLMLSVIVWIPIIAGYHWAALALGLHLSVVQTAFVTCIAALSISAPSSPGQVGVYEAAVTFALVGVLGQPEAKSASLAFLLHATNFVLLAALGAVGLNRMSATLASVVRSTRAVMEARSRG